MQSRLLSLLALPFAFATAHADLAGYLAKPDSSYKWELRDKTAVPGGTLYDVRLTSQTWQDIVWQHSLNVFVPEKPVATGSAMLMIDGGSQNKLDQKPGPDAIMYGSMLASKVGVPVAVLQQ